MVFTTIFSFLAFLKEPFLILCAKNETDNRNSKQNLSD